ncbi:RnfABCDGE type electron transport complex subunit G [Psittacicella gerlachiana]|uniref:Ion-translocating oxidoreductase complex subunit G n=1 Tax=Psittacicella gerlachiana TaxID=2028574 RepID=A0A3A1YMA9_9GAMM|nr:RnfABCDGE type electron transport complex subunit G [Psittacicella gerlachiana]RIY37157.1 hypothetical protein CKF59_01920 [Psittacicella gerlachiana]
MFFKYLSRNTITLVVATIAGIGSLSLVNYALKARIADAQDNALRQTIVNLGQAFPSSNYDNDISKSCYIPKLGVYSNDPKVDTLMLATKQGQITGYILISSTWKGYSGLIRTMLVTDSRGTIKAVRILEQNETPGLGNKVITTDWVHSFDNLQLSQAQLPYLAVKKDGGQIDEFTGATITPRAIVNQIRINMQEVVKDLVNNPHALQDNFITCSTAQGDK